MIKSIYIHIPFCHHICSYCDFTKMYYNEELANKYIEALEKEISLRYQGELIETLYIGGGTPSFLSNNNLEKLLTVLKKIKLAQEYEYTMECNVEDLTKVKLKLLKDNDVNRLSIGLQTFNPKYLKILARPENKVEKKIGLAKKYFNNINVDLIYALPDQTIEELDEDLEKILSLQIPHIALYSLIIEPHTKLFIDGLNPIEEELDSQMFYHINKKLTSLGYKHYEISNYAQEGFPSKHNLTYWNNDQYYGFGLGASGYIDEIRYTNTRNINKYLAGSFNDYQEILTKQDMMSYELILGLRKIEGINLTSFKNKYKKDIWDIFNIQDLIDDNWLIIEDDWMFINSKYLYLSNLILERFV